MKPLLFTLGIALSLASAQGQYVVFCSVQPDSLGYCDDNYAFTLPEGSYIYALCDLEDEVLGDIKVYYEIYSVDAEGTYTYEFTVEQDVDVDWAWFWMPILLPRSGTYEVVVWDDMGYEFDVPLALDRVVVEFE